MSLSITEVDVFKLFRPKLTGKLLDKLISMQEIDARSRTGKQKSKD